MFSVNGNKKIGPVKAYWYP